MKLYPDTKVYVTCPANFQTGGLELAHQFASTLMSFGVHAYMFYFKSAKSFNEEDPVHDAYKKISLKKTNLRAIALPQGFNGGTSLLIEKLQSKSLMLGFIVNDFMSTAEMAKL